MQKVSPHKKRTHLGPYFKDNWQLYAMLLVPVAFVIIFIGGNAMYSISSFKKQSYKVHEAAKILNVSTKTIRNYDAQGILHA